MRDSNTSTCFSHHPSASGGCVDALPSIHVASAPIPESVVPEKAGIGKEDKAGDGGESRIVLKSCLRNPVGYGPGGVRKGRVSWRDVEGKELAEIREFDCYEIGRLCCMDTADTDMGYGQFQVNKKVVWHEYEHVYSDLRRFRGNDDGQPTCDCVIQ